MKIKKKPVVVEKELELVDAPVVKMFMNKNLPDYLASVMEAWKLIGNKWSTCLEAELLLFTQDRKLETKLDITACRVLAYMGLMAVRQGDLGDFYVNRYRLTKEGLKALGASEHLGYEKVTSLPEKRGTAKSKVVQLELTPSNDVDCPMCGGEGLDDAGDVCEDCNGTGVVPVKKTVTKVPVKVKRK